MLQGVEQIFENREEMITGLKRATYQKNMEGFLDKFGHYFDEMNAYMGETDDPEAAAEAIGLHLMHAAEKQCGNRRGKLDGRTRSEISLFMVYYVFPAIIKQGEHAEELADGVLKVSRKVLRNKELQYADYETIYNGFSDKILGFITKRK